MVAATWTCNMRCRLLHNEIQIIDYPSAMQVIATGRRPFFYLYDLAADKIERLPGPQGHPMKSLETFAVSPVSASGVCAYVPEENLLNSEYTSPQSWQSISQIHMSPHVRNHTAVLSKCNASNECCL